MIRKCFLANTGIQFHCESFKEVTLDPNEPPRATGVCTYSHRLQVFTHTSQVLTPFSRRPQQTSCHPRTRLRVGSGSLVAPPSLAQAWARAQARTRTHARIVLRPALHGALSTLATLTNSNHTLLPFTRSLSHFTVHSGSNRATCTICAARTCSVQQAAAAAGAARSDGGDGDGDGGESVSLPSEFDVDDMDSFVSFPLTFSPLFLASSANLVLPLCPAVCSESSSAFALSVCYPLPLCPNRKAHYTMSAPSTSTVTR